MIGLIGQLEQVTNTFLNILGAPLIVARQELQLTRLCLEELAEKTFFQLEMRLLLRHRQQRLHLVGDQQHEAQEIRLLRQRQRRTAREARVLRRRLEQRQRPFRMPDALAQAHAMQRPVEQLDGAFIVGVAPRQMHRPVHM